MTYALRTVMDRIDADPANPDPFDRIIITGSHDLGPDNGGVELVCQPLGEGFAAPFAAAPESLGTVYRVSEDQLPAPATPDTVIR